MQNRNSKAYFRDIALRMMKEKTDNLCGICGKTLSDEVTTDHIIPVLYGGSDNPANLRPVHTDCHAFRHGMLRGMDIAEEKIRRAKRKKDKEHKRPLDSKFRKQHEIAKIQEILTLKAQGKNITHIAEELEISRPTVYDYLRKAVAYQVTECGNA